MLSRCIRIENNWSLAVRFALQNFQAPRPAKFTAIRNPSSNRKLLGACEPIARTVVLDLLSGKRPRITIYGTNYDTPEDPRPCTRGRSRKRKILKASIRDWQRYSVPR